MNILTFDIEEWFHSDFISGHATWAKYEPRIYRSVEKILQQLEEKNRKGTFFVLGWVAENYPEVVKQIHNQGHEVGCHSYFHGLAHQMSPQEFLKDTENAVKPLKTPPATK
jgi:peptidoglycan-N-acetylglucosamine deacetylase